MIALVLAATVITAPATVEDGCDPQQLQQLVSVPRNDRIEAEMELDRRIASTLAEERKAGAAVAEAAARVKEAEGQGQLRWAMWGLSLAALGIFVVGFRRRSNALAVAGFALAMLVPVTGMALGGGVQGARKALLESTERQLAVTQCRFRVADARMQMMQTRIATTTHDLDEADEDIWGWVTKLENEKQPVSVETMKKLHNEIRESLRH